MLNSHNNPLRDNPLAIHTLPIGYCLNEFEIEKVIGKGGFGIVYRAWDHHLKQSIAIKEYMPVSLVIRGEDLTLKLRRKSFRDSFQIGLTNFMREAHFMSCFRHPCLPPFLRFWQKNGTAYIATSFYNGMTLKALQAKQPEIINQRWLCNILYSLLDAIDTLHQAAYLHCDISLDNILIQENGTPILLDLGSARKLTDRLADKSEITIRPGFTPIEQYTANDEGQQGPWTDIYALGAALHTLIAGSPPPVSIVRNIEDHYQPLVKRHLVGYSLSFLHAIDCALSIQPSERPMTISELAALIKLPARESCLPLTLSGSGTLSEY
ncbi:serine/threonine-protein kinase PknK [Xenorhabdus beddingii]|uniref:Serine/threonine-protein kinase PknK n=1 Tax=Xenorhabdus beddingii TaxID=40578 RepID=A0A1Y2SQZ0_9GAMM|nr:serine/threonine-protein kinase [Xenorhabdus beddingii]OTA20660.1 serine/threonine-protein kinase PknK [Xenorhabdus beddingii]